MKPQLISRIPTELIRIVASAAIIAACFYPDTGALQTALFIFGVFLTVALISHVTRKYALFPYVDMRKFADKALEDSVGSGLVFLGICSIIAVSISTAATFFSR